MYSYRLKLYKSEVRSVNVPDRDFAARHVLLGGMMGRLVNDLIRFDMNADLLIDRVRLLPCREAR